MFVVDTNILVYAANRAAPEARRAHQLLEAFATSDEQWFITWGSVYEFLRVVTHPTLQPPLTGAEAWAFLDDLFSATSLSMLEPTGRHFAVLREVLEEVSTVSGNVMFDVRTAVLMREHGVRRIVTHDRDFARFPFVEVVDPLA